MRRYSYGYFGMKNRSIASRPGLTALLDVTYPEPPVDGHPFYTLPNCLLTPHIAGSAGDELARMGEYMLTECQAYLGGKPCKYEVSIVIKVFIKPCF